MRGNALTSAEIVVNFLKVVFLIASEEFCCQVVFAVSKFLSALSFSFVQPGFLKNFEEEARLFNSLLRQGKRLPARIFAIPQWQDSPIPTASGICTVMLV